MTYIKGEGVCGNEEFTPPAQVPTHPPPEASFISSPEKQLLSSLPQQCPLPENGLLFQGTNWAILPSSGTLFGILSGAPIPLQEFEPGFISSLLSLPSVSTGTHHETR